MPRSEIISRARQPIGLEWRSSVWFTTLVVWLGLVTDLLIYSIITPAMPFQLEKLGYTKVSSLVGWPLFSYSAGLVVSTIPIAMISEKYNTRRMPMLLGLVILIGSQIMFMEAPIFAVMCIARILQGFGSSIVWIAGLALLCDTTPEHLVGRQLGIAMSGISLGVILGPPIGGALYSHFGFRGPFIFGLGVCVVDLLNRLLVIEKKHAPLYVDESPAIPETTAAQKEEANTRQANATPGAPHSSVANAQHRELRAETPELTPSLSLFGVIGKLARSPRTLVSLVISFVYGVTYTGPEPSIVLHLESIWGLESRKVGLVFLAGALPTLLSSIIAGWCADAYGTEWAACFAMLLAFPWWIVITINGPLALFIVAFSLEYFFAAGVTAPLTAELATISRTTEGIGYAHVYGAFNIIYGVGSAVGPVIIGAIYDHVKHGWTVICLLAMSLNLACLILAFVYTGGDPLWARFARLLRRRTKLDPVPDSNTIHC